MPYADGRVYLDADSHMMELGDWLTGYVDADIRDKLRPLPREMRPLVDMAVAHAEVRRSDPAAVADLENHLLTAKGWAALGAFDPGERSRALDLLGFDRQLVFTTFALAQFHDLDDPDVRWRALRGHNRGIVDFCSGDPRLMAVAQIALDDPGRAAAEVEHCLADGAAAVQVHHDAPPKISHTHPDYDGVWGRLHDAQVPFLLHIGGSRHGIRRSLHRNGLPRVADIHGGGENIRARDFLAVHHSAEIFLAVMAMDGVFERFDRLRGAAVELGALWVPSLLARLDLAVRSFRRTEPKLTSMELSPAEYLRRQVKFTPFPGEPVGDLMAEAGEELFLFSSDYPHPEGTRDPWAASSARSPGPATPPETGSTRATSPSCSACRSTPDHSVRSSGHRVAAPTGLLGLVHGQIGVAHGACSGCSRPGCDRAMPMVAPTDVTTVGRRAADGDGPATAAESRSAVARARSSVTSRSRTANSSPPTRHTRSPGRLTADPDRSAQRAATVRSTWSPPSWPSVSLTGLKWSRSTNSTANGARLRVGASSSRWAANTARLGRPVRGSWAAWSARWSWKALRSLTSWHGSSSPPTSRWSRRSTVSMSNHR